MSVFVGDLLGGCTEIAVPDFHVGICLVDNFDENDELLDVGAHHIVESIFDNHSVVYDVDDKTLTLDIRELGGHSFENVGHHLAALIVEPLGSKQSWIVLLQHVQENDLNDDVNELRNRLIKL